MDPPRGAAKQLFIGALWEIPGVILGCSAWPGPGAAGWSEDRSGPLVQPDGFMAVVHRGQRPYDGGEFEGEFDGSYGGGWC